MKKLSVNEAVKMLDQINLIDIRQEFEHKANNIPGVINIEMQDIVKHPEKHISKDKEYYLMCQTGSRSSTASKLLNMQGYKTQTLSDGIKSLKKY